MLLEDTHDIACLEFQLTMFTHIQLPFEGLKYLNVQKPWCTEFLNEPYPQLRHNIKMAGVMGGTMYREVNISLCSL